MVLSGSKLGVHSFLTIKASSNFEPQQESFTLNQNADRTKEE
jgi:hypothetical protein